MKTEFERMQSRLPMDMMNMKRFVGLFKGFRLNGAVKLDHAACKVVCMVVGLVSYSLMTLTLNFY